MNLFRFLNLRLKGYTVLLIVFLSGCSQKPDFKTFPKIDAHVHLETSDDSFVQVLKENNFKLMTLVTGSASQPVINEEFDFAKALHDKYPEFISFATTFSMDGFGEPGWQQRTIEWLQESFDKGAIAVKVWKDIGMTFRDKDSSFIMIDDERFDPVWDFIEAQNKTLVNHIGEPRNCWLPVDSMTVPGDKKYYSNHPQYYMYLHPGYPSHQELMEARDRMLKKHPGLRYVGCHLGSMEWDVNVQAKWLDNHPDCALDMASRIEHFKVQDPDKVRKFIIKYQDQLLYATDISVQDENPDFTTRNQVEEVLNQVWLKDWEYFTTDKIIENSSSGKYKCLNLPVSVLSKIYSENALKMYPGFGLKR